MSKFTTLYLNSIYHFESKKTAELHLKLKGYVKDNKTEYHYNSQISAIARKQVNNKEYRIDFYRVCI